MHLRMRGITNLIEFFENVTKKVDEDGAIDIVVVHMGFCKAFDKVLHDRLLWKIRLHGIQRFIAK